MNCPYCFHHCLLQEGKLSFCKTRTLKNGKNVSLNYGMCTSLALDPIEKKPLKEFYPGSFILSYGSYGCNLSCPFCQNYEISQTDLSSQATYISPERLVDLALKYQSEGNIGIAFTYNEPTISPEYIRDAGKLAKAKGLKVVVVTNGEASSEAIKEFLPYVDAYNIDLKGFREDYFRYIGGNLEAVKNFIETAAKVSHVELTTLVVPGKNDDEKAFEKECQYIASIDNKIPLHITRYFPRYKERASATSIRTLEEFQVIAKKYLRSVYLGNV